METFLFFIFLKKEDFFEIDFLSIDVDGIDYYLLKELKFNPKVICIEYNFWFGKDLEASVPYSDNFVWKQGTVYSGASLSALNKLANSTNPRFTSAPKVRL